MLSPALPLNELSRQASLERMNLTTTPDDLALDRITTMAKLHFGVPIALVSLIDGERQWFKSCQGLSVRETPRNVSFCGHAILGEGIFLIEDAFADARFADNPLVTGEPHVRFYAGFPLENSEGYMVGTLCIIDHQPRAFSAADAQMLTLLGGTAQTLLAHKKTDFRHTELLTRLGQAERELLLDAHLRVWNKQAMANFLSSELDTANNTGRPLALCVMDVDNFKQVNDTLGHLAGDSVLIQVVAHLRTAIRTDDLLGRLGGDEFIALLPGVGLAHAERIGQKMARALPPSEDVPSGLPPVTLSIGIAVFDPAQASQQTITLPRMLLAHADAAMYQAKRNGKNGYVIQLVT